MRERGRRRPNRGRRGWDAEQGGVRAQGEEKGGQGEMGYPGKDRGATSERDKRRNRKAERRAREEGRRGLQPRPQAQSQGGDVPRPPTAGSGTGSQRGPRARKPGCQVSAAPGGEWLQSASSAEAGFPVLWSFPETAVRLCVATGCPDVVSCHVEVSAVTPTSQVGKTEAQKGLTAAVGDRDSTRVCLAPGPMLGYPQEQDITLSVTKCFPFSL